MKGVRPAVLAEPWNAPEDAQRLDRAGGFRGAHVGRLPPEVLQQDPTERRADGTWFSWWDAKLVSVSGYLDIDHVVSLAEAWLVLSIRVMARLITRAGGEIVGEY